MLQHFFSNFHLVPSGQVPNPAWDDPWLMRSAGYAELMEQFAGLTFEGGLYRLHDASSGPKGAEALAEAFPEFSSRARPFGYDWLGRQFAIDLDRVEDGQALVLLMEPGTGEALEVPLSFAAFHDQLDDHREPALAAGFFADWAKVNPALLPLRHEDCAGYGVPLFLGGEDTVENLEVIDMDVYWSLCAQLHKAARDLPPGTKIRSISIGN